ncbi:MAG: tyrosine-type recombinase/integrase [Waterburya sp.]
MKSITLKGFRAVTRGKKIYYYYDTNTRKNRKLIPLGNDFYEAIEKHNELSNAHFKKKTNTFNDIFLRYMKEVIPQKAARTQKDNLNEAQHLLKFFDNAPISQVKPQHIRQYLDWRREAKTRANREIALFSHVFNCAREWGYTDSTNPCLGVKRHKEQTRKNIYIDNQKFMLVFNAGCAELKRAMQLAVFTGQRVADVLKMSWADIYEEQGKMYLFICQNKTSVKLSIQICQQLNKLLQECDKKNQTILGLTESGLRKRFNSARSKAGINANDFQFRDLRAMAAESMANNSSLKDAQALLGHSNESMTKHYSERNPKGVKVEANIFKMELMDD